MKLFGLLVIGFCIGAFGFINTSKILQSQKQLAMIADFIDKVKEYICYSQTPVSEIISRESADEKFSFLRCFVEGDTMQEYYKRVCFYNERLCINSEDEKRLFDFFIGLGTTDLAGQINHCNIYKDAFCRSFAENKQKDSSKIKLYPSLSVLGGLLVLVVFI